MIDARLGGLYRGLRKIIGKSIELQITDELKVEISDLIGKNLAMPMHTTIGCYWLQLRADEWFSK